MFSVFGAKKKPFKEGETRFLPNRTVLAPPHLLGKVNNLFVTVMLGEFISKVLT